MSLSAKLKSVFTSSDTFTVLQLIDKLISTVKDYEVESVPLYRHTLQVRSANGSRAICSFTSFSDDPIDTSEKFAQWIAEQGNYFQATGYYLENGTYYPVYAVRGMTLTSFTLVCYGGNQVLEINYIGDKVTDMTKTI